MAPLVLAWVGVGIYLLSAILYATSEFADFVIALKRYSGYYAITEDYYSFQQRLSDLLVFPGLFVVLLATALVLTVKRGN